MSQINLYSPTTFTSGFLITDTSNPAGVLTSSDSIPQMTQVGGVTISACLELQSTLGALVFPRMTTAQRDLMTVTNGMAIYNLTANTVQLRIAGVWSDIASGGDVVGPGVSAIPNVPVFNNLTGSLLADSGIRLFGALTNSVYLGELTGNLVSTGTNNIGLGRQAGAAITTASRCTFLGDQSGLLATTTVLSADSTGIGASTFSLATTSVKSVAIGSLAASLNASYTECTLIGYQADCGANGLTNATAIGYQATVSSSNSLVLGALANVGIGTAQPVASLHILQNPGSFGGVILPYRTSALDAITVDFTDYTIFGSANDGAITFTLPVATATHAGQIFILRSAGNNILSITPQGGQLIDGQPGTANYGLNVVGDLKGVSVCILCIGNQWLTISVYGSNS